MGTEFFIVISVFPVDLLAYQVALQIGQDNSICMLNMILG